MTDEQQYFAADSGFQEELHRLQLIESLGDPYTTRYLKELGVESGWQCLEVGAGAGSIARWLSERVGPSGRVVAADIDTRFLGDLTLANVEVRSQDVTKDELEIGAFDLVHCRTLLCHLGDPEAVLARMMAALVPGGWILAEEPDFGIIEATDKTHPLAPSFDSSNPKRFRFLKEAGIMDSYLGRTLPSLMEGDGLIEVQNEGQAGIARGGDAASLNWTYVCDRLDGHLRTQGVLNEESPIVGTPCRTRSSPTAMALCSLFGANDRNSGGPSRAWLETDPVARHGFFDANAFSNRTVSGIGFPGEVA